MTCYFCDSDQGMVSMTKRYPPQSVQYMCPRCGHVSLYDLTADDLPAERWYQEKDNRRIISIWIRNEYEKRNQELFREPLLLRDLIRIIKQYSPLDPIAKMENALLNINKQSKHIDHNFTVSVNEDYPYYHCFERVELAGILKFLLEDDFIATDQPGKKDYRRPIHITSKGYERIREIQRRRVDSRQCFVAMWFTPLMDEVYETAIKPAIEYREENETESRFRALNIGEKEHTNDINDEIIAQIRRSKFMVCDLTGYRGGVYWEAGFAYGLGLEVIYTCEKDWIKESPLLDKDGLEVKELQDKEGNKVELKKEGIHFDIEHRKRIKWSMDDPDGFKERLEKRIRAVIV